MRGRQNDDLWPSRQEVGQVNPQLQILVLVPDEDLRRSIAFVLEAEGFAVFSSSHIPDASSGLLTGAGGCAVVDETVLLAEGAADRLARLCRPIILLTNRAFLSGPLSIHTTIMKPLLGRGLVDAVVSSMPVPAAGSAAT
jgi:hypothetical protein